MSTAFGTSLREWRHHRRLSQLDLAVAADVSQRHLSFLETGKSKPSREMVIHLGVVLDRTCFYAEAGGQQADHGRLFVSHETRSHAGDAHHGGEFRVEEVRGFGGYVVHVGRMIRGELRVGDEVTCNVDHARRKRLASNHTATHLFNHALREVVGGASAPEQRGSLVAPDRLRFDFDASGPIAPADIAAIEARVRDAIKADLPVHADLLPQDKALAINGLRAVFGEKYPNPVRVVAIGPPIDDILADPDNDRWRSYSVELCGGTHLSRTGEAGSFAIVHEEGVAKGIRRVVALTGEEAHRAIAEADALQAGLERASSLPEAALPEAVAELSRRIDAAQTPLARKDALRRDLADLQERLNVRVVLHPSDLDVIRHSSPPSRRLQPARTPRCSNPSHPIDPPPLIH